MKPTIADAAQTADARITEALQRVTGHSGFAQQMRQELTKFQAAVRSLMQRTAQGIAGPVDEADILERRFHHHRAFPTNGTLYLLAIPGGDATACGNSGSTPGRSLLTDPSA